MKKIWENTCGKIFLILLGITISACLISFGLLYMYFKNSEKLTNERIQEVATIYDIEPTADAVAEYIHCDILVFGKPKEQILSQLLLMEESNIAGDFDGDQVEIWISGPLHSVTGDLMLYFDKNDNLTSKYSMTRMKDERPMVCP